MSDPAGSQDDFPRSFETAFARLQTVVVEACSAQPEWRWKVAAALAAVLRLAAADPDAVRVLTNGALARGAEGIVRHERLLAYLCDGLRPGRRERAGGERLPDVTEKALVGGMVTLVAQRVERGEAGRLPAMSAEAIEFVLTPYLDAPEAKRVAALYSAQAAG